VFFFDLVAIASARRRNDGNSRRAGVEILLHHLQQRVRAGGIVLTEFPDHGAAVLRTKLR
jgi:hypothetical protein